MLYDLTIMGFTSYSRRAQGRRSSSRQEIDGLSISRRTSLFPPRGRKNDDGGEEARKGERSPSGGQILLFSMEQRKWNWEGLQPTLVTPRPPSPTGRTPTDAEGLMAGLNLGGCDEE